MRILVASPSKTGNVWVKILLAETYHLKVLDNVPAIPLKSLQEFVRQGRFVDQSIFHQHFRPTPPFFELVDALHVHLVTTLRHPYDVFVSLFFHIQRLSHQFLPGTHFYPLVGKAIDDEEVIAYLKRGDDGFGLQVNLALSWLQSGRSIVVRYEDLLTDTFSAFKSVTDRIQPVPDRTIRRVVRNNQADRMRRKSRTLDQHIRKATQGDWRNHLTARHLEAINTAHGETIERLGYRLHSDPEA